MTILAIVTLPELTAGIAALVFVFGIVVGVGLILYADILERNGQ